MKKQFLSLILALAMLMGMGVVAASAETDVAGAPTNSIDMEELLGVTNDELFELYVDNTLYGYSWSTFSDAARENLTSQQKQLYDYAAPIIKSIATGGQASARIALPAESLRAWGFTIDGSFTASDMDSKIAAANAALEPHLDVVRHALILDMPFDFYWSNASGYGLGYSMSTYADGSGTFTLMPSFLFGVDGDFRAATYDENNPTVDTAKTAATSTATEKANEIVAKYQNVSDYDKIIGYIDEICELTSYNTAAAESGSSASDNSPWQLLYVFDDDPSTEVVCEGYAKAFQYLCDLTSFNSSKVESRIVTGNMSGGTGEGPHMWNVVTMNDGKNYIVDVTNSEIGTVGQAGELKLGYAPTGSFPNYDPTPDNKDDSWGTTHIIRCNNSQQPMYFTYDADLPYNNDQLTISNTAYNSLARYNIIINATDNGTVYPSDNITPPEVGDSVTLFIFPDSGFALEKLVVDEVDVTAQVNMYGGTYAFTMPAKDVVVEATFARFYTIIIDPNGGHITSSGELVRSLLTDTNGMLSDDRIKNVPASFHFDGHIISSYNTKPDGSGDTVDLSSQFTSDTTIYVIWEEVEIKLLKNGTEVSPDEPDAFITAGDELTVQCNDPSATIEWAAGAKPLPSGADYTVKAEDFSDREILSVLIKSGNSSTVYYLTYTTPRLEVSLFCNGEEVWSDHRITAGDKLTVQCNDPSATIEWKAGAKPLPSGADYTVKAEDFSDREILSVLISSGNSATIYYLIYTTPALEVNVFLNGEETSGEDYFYVGDVISVHFTGGDGIPSFQWENESGEAISTNASYTVDANDFSYDYERLTLTVYPADGSSAAYYDFYYIMDEYRLTVKANGKTISASSLVLNGDVLTVTYGDPSVTDFRWKDDFNQLLGTGATYTVPATGLSGDPEAIYVEVYNNEGEAIAGMPLTYLNNARPEAGKYLIYTKIAPVAGGSIDASASVAEKGDTIEFTIKPADGYRLLMVEVLDMDDYAGVPFEPVDDDTYRFTMPDANVRILTEYTNGFLINHTDDESGCTMGFLDAQAGDEVIVWARSYYEGYNVDSITVTGVSGKTYPVTGPDYQMDYSFVMPSEDVTVSATFKKLEALDSFVSNYTTEEVLSNGDTVQVGDELAAFYNGPSSYWPEWVAENFTSSDSVIIVPEGISEITLNLYDYFSASTSPVATYTFNVALPAYTVSVSIDPATATVETGGSQQFTVSITGADDVEPSITWSVSGNASANTTISSTGLLTVGADETAASLTVDITLGNDPTPVIFALVTVKQVDAPVAYTVTFDPNGGTGTMAAITVTTGTCQLPQCAFTAPQGKQFKAWSINSTEYAPGAAITITADTVIKAVWSDAPIVGQAPVITAPTAAQSVSGKPGDKVTMSITATGATTYQWYVNRQDGKGYVAIIGATAASYTTSAVETANSGYTYYCVASNATGTAKSPVFTLTVEPQVPQTGDSAPLALWLMLMLLSSVGLLAMMAKGRKQN